MTSTGICFRQNKGKHHWCNCGKQWAILKQKNLKCRSCFSMILKWAGRHSIIQKYIPFCSQISIKPGNIHSKFKMFERWWLKQVYCFVLILGISLRYIHETKKKVEDKNRSVYNKVTKTEIGQWSLLCKDSHFFVLF